MLNRMIKCSPEGLGYNCSLGTAVSDVAMLLISQSIRPFSVVDFGYASSILEMIPIPEGVKCILCDGLIF